MNKLVLGRDSYQFCTFLQFIPVNFLASNLWGSLKCSERLSETKLFWMYDALDKYYLRVVLLAKIMAFKDSVLEGSIEGI